MEPVYIWLIAGFVLLSVEVVTGTFLFLALGIAALTTSLLVYLFNLELIPALYCWLGLSVASGSLIYVLLRRVKLANAGLGGAQYIGEIGTVIQPEVGEIPMRVKFILPMMGSDTWTARAHPNQADRPFTSGDKVKIVEFLGNEIIVQHAS